MPHRYFTKEIGQGVATLSGAEAHHLARVMRAKIGQEVILCGADAREYQATITSITEELVSFAIDEGTQSLAEPWAQVTVFAGYPKQDKLEQIIKHGVELGAVEFVPFFSRYCVAAPKKEDQKNVRYNRIAHEAAKQSGRGIVPQVAMPMPNFGAVCTAFADYDLVLFCYEHGGVSLPSLLAPVAQQRAAVLAQLGAGETTEKRVKIALVTGAEGGFSEAEAQAAAQAGAKTISLGARILRCETAPLAALAATMTILGELE